MTTSVWIKGKDAQEVAKEMIEAINYFFNNESARYSCSIEVETNGSIGVFVRAEHLLPPSTHALDEIEAFMNGFLQGKGKQ